MKLCDLRLTIGFGNKTLIHVNLGQQKRSRLQNKKG